MDASSGFEEVAELGRKLVEHLDREGGDLLVSWMSHHVARLIAEARDAPPERKEEAEDRCRGAILDLWRERRSLNAPPPLASVDRIAQTMATLRDPAAGWYLSRLEDRGEPGDPALRTALLVDNAAKEIIRWCLCEALGQNLAEDARWLAWIGAPLFSGERDLELARGLVANYMLFNAPQDPDSAGGRARAQIIKYMNGIAELAALLSDRLQAEGRGPAARPEEDGSDGGHSEESDGTG
ncbi:MAG TPA: hypothetical protein VF582_04765 [Allosphingosinicella sp.]|jgi:hypothetical protein